LEPSLEALIRPFIFTPNRWKTVLHVNFITITFEVLLMVRRRRRCANREAASCRFRCGQIFGAELRERLTLTSATSETLVYQSMKPRDAMKPVWVPK
jgi:hypothetical protein